MKESETSNKLILDQLYSEYKRNTNAFLEVSRKISKTENKNMFELLRQRELEIMNESKALVKKILPSLNNPIS